MRAMEDAVFIYWFSMGAVTRRAWKAFPVCRVESVKEGIELCNSKYEMHRSLFAEGIFQCQCAM